MIFDEVKNYSTGEFKTGSSSIIHTIISTLDGNKLSHFNESTMDDLNEIVDFAKKLKKRGKK